MPTQPQELTPRKPSFMRRAARRIASAGGRAAAQQLPGIGPMLNAADAARFGATVPPQAIADAATKATANLPGVGPVVQARQGFETGRANPALLSRPVVSTLQAIPGVGPVATGVDAAIIGAREPAVQGSVVGGLRSAVGAFPIVGPAASAAMTGLDVGNKIGTQPPPQSGVIGEPVLTLVPGAPAQTPPGTVAVTPAAPPATSPVSENPAARMTPATQPPPALATAGTTRPSTPLTNMTPAESRAAADMTAADAAVGRVLPKLAARNASVAAQQAKPGWNPTEPRARMEVRPLNPPEPIDYDNAQMGFNLPGLAIVPPSTRRGQDVMGGNREAIYAAQTAKNAATNRNDLAAMEATAGLRASLVGATKGQKRANISQGASMGLAQAEAKAERENRLAIAKATGNATTGYEKVQNVWHGPDGKQVDQNTSARLDEEDWYAGNERMIDQMAPAEALPAGHVWAIDEDTGEPGIIPEKKVGTGKRADGKGPRYTKDERLTKYAQSKAASASRADALRSAIAKAKAADDTAGAAVLEKKLKQLTGG